MVVLLAGPHSLGPFFAISAIIQLFRKRSSPFDPTNQFWPHLTMRNVEPGYLQSSLSLISILINLSELHLHINKLKRTKPGQARIAPFSASSENQTRRDGSTRVSSVAISFLLVAPSVNYVTPSTGF